MLLNIVAFVLTLVILMLLVLDVNLGIIILGYDFLFSIQHQMIARGSHFSDVFTYILLLKERFFVQISILLT